MAQTNNLKKGAGKRILESTNQPLNQKKSCLLASIIFLTRNLGKKFIFLGLHVLLFNQFYHILGGYLSKP